MCAVLATFVAADPPINALEFEWRPEFTQIMNDGVYEQHLTLDL